MKSKTMVSVKSRLVRTALICGIAGCGLLWARVPLARATDAAANYARFSSVLRQMKAELNLTAAQQAKLEAIMRDAIPRGMAIHDARNLSAEQKRTKLRELRSATRRRIESVLTAEQRRKAQAMLSSARPRVEARLKQVAQELELSENQKTEIRPILADAFRQGLAIKDDMELTVAEKISKAQQLRAETRQQLGSILTAEQLKRLDRIVSSAHSEIAALVQAHRRGHVG